MDREIDHAERDDAERQFGRALRRGQLAPLSALLRGGGPGLPALEEVRGVLRPTAERYVGMRTAAVASIVGSEGRADDFDRAFRPRRQHIRRRWTSILLAHARSIELPAVKLYEIGGLYFVWDRNHRVSVARARGIQYLDAEVTSLATDVPLAPGMTVEGMRRAVLEHERKLYSGALERFPAVAGSELAFSEPGGYDEVLAHIACRRETLRRAGGSTDPESAARSWYEGIYLPLARLVRDAGMPAHLPGRTAADVYLWLVGHWDEMERLPPGRADTNGTRRSFLGRLGRRRGGRTSGSGRGTSGPSS
jgi:hypothetical protein